MSFCAIFSCHFPEGFAALSADVVLHCPLDEWPAFRGKNWTLWAKPKELEASANLVR